jgi:hypothetical protein
VDVNSERDSSDSYNISFSWNMACRMNYEQYEKEKNMNKFIDQVIEVVVILAVLFLFIGCAPASERRVTCAPYIAGDGSKGFWDLERDVPVDGHVCDEIVVR